jgi:hypothetical protein
MAMAVYWEIKKVINLWLVNLASVNIKLSLQYGSTIAIYKDE